MRFYACVSIFRVVRDLLRLSIFFGSMGSTHSLHESASYARSGPSKLSLKLFFIFSLSDSYALPPSSISSLTMVMTLIMRRGDHDDHDDFGGDDDVHDDNDDRHHDDDDHVISKSSM